MARGRTLGAITLAAADSTTYVVLNLHPYNPGHLLICPYRHVPLYVDLTEEETAEFTALTKRAIRGIDAASGAIEVFRFHYNLDQHPADCGYLLPPGTGDEPGRM